MKHEQLCEYPLVISLPLQWGDQDAFGHVNNTIYLRWCETARVQYLMRIGLWMISPEGIGPILASFSCDYRRPLTYPDTVHVGARVTRIGTSSFRMEHRVVSDSLGVVAADAHSTIVVLDYKVQKSTPMPEAVRKEIERIEGRKFERAARPA
jgi:acyl-CoA thioester hydrolase